MLWAMTTVISSHVKDKNCILTGYQIFVSGNILVFHRCLYNNNYNSYCYYNLCFLLALSRGSDDSVIETDPSKFHLVKCRKVRCSMLKLRPNIWMGRPMNLSIDSKIGTSKNNPQQLIATVIVKVLGSKRLLLFTFFLFFSVPPSPPPPPSLLN